MKPRALLIRAAGTNCDAETARAFELAGASVETLHVNRVAEAPSLLEGYQLLGVPGGFSFGDDIAAGRIFALHLSRRLGDAMRNFVEEGKPVLGVCNGFQVLIQTGLLPGDVEGAGNPPCSLSTNDSGRFTDRWVTLQTVESPCVWTQGLGRMELPIAHGEGRLACRSEADAQRLFDQRRVALVYAEGSNPNGSMRDIAGLTDASGLVLGLMPHPERHLLPTQHYAWTRRDQQPAHGDGYAFFANAVRHARELVIAG